MRDLLLLLVILLGGTAFVLVLMWTLTHFTEKHRLRAEYRKPIVLPGLTPVMQMELLDTHAMDLGTPHVVRKDEITGTWGYWFFSPCGDCGARVGKSCPCDSRSMHIRKISEAKR
jgi:hypothetical protein